MLSIKTPQGNNGIILPRVKLEKLDAYTSTGSNPMIGVLVENTISIGNITRGIYMERPNLD